MPLIKFSESGVIPEKEFINSSGSKQVRLAVSPQARVIVTNEEADVRRSRPAHAAPMAEGRILSMHCFVGVCDAKYETMSRQGPCLKRQASIGLVSGKGIHFRLLVGGRKTRGE